MYVYFLDKERKVYEYVVRHFLACLSKDAEGEETIVNIEINDEKVQIYCNLYLYCNS